MLHIFPYVAERSVLLSQAFLLGPDHTFKEFIHILRFPGIHFVFTVSPEEVQ